MKVHKGIWIGALILLLAGVTILTFPHIAQIIFNYRVESLITAYDKRIEVLTNDEKSPLDPLYEWMLAYNNELYETKQSGLVDPFSYQQMEPALLEAGLADEIFGYLHIAKMDIDLPIYLGANKDNLAKGAAHLTQTSLPIGGLNSNAVFAAHRGMGTAAMFRDIEKLEINDEVIITNFWGSMTYYVVEIAIISPTNIGAILIQDDRDLITLITCHPYRHNYQRYVVYCEREKTEP